jgi:gluconokinase
VVLTLDIGTSSLRAILFDMRARPIPGSESQIRYEMRTTPDGGVEADADELFVHACRAINNVLLHTSPSAFSIVAVGSDSLVSNVLGVDATGHAVTPVYTYADTRCARQVQELRERFDEEATHQRVGTLFHTSYLPARFLWLAQEHPDLLQKARFWMSLGEYFNFRWLGQRACSYSVASWTGLLNRQQLAWDAELLSSLPITADQLSPLVDVTTALRGLTHEFAARWQALVSAAWFPTAGDGATANVGSGCVDPTRTALTIGTTSAMRVTVPSLSGAGSGTPLPVPRGLWSYRVDAGNELIGGALSEGGSLFAWMQDTLRVDNTEDLERALAEMQPDGHGLTVLPFLAGERAPGWVPDARASILGLSLNTQPIEILRAGLEAVAYRLALIFELLRTVAPDAQEVIASGGALMHSPTWVQIVADVLGVPVIASAEQEATSRGTALLALKGLRVINSLKDLPAALGPIYAPDPARHEIYAEAVKRQQKWYNLIVGQRE